MAAVTDLADAAAAVTAGYKKIQIDRSTAAPPNPTAWHRSATSLASRSSSQALAPTARRLHRGGRVRRLGSGSRHAGCDGAQRLPQTPLLRCSRQGLRQ